MSRPPISPAPSHGREVAIRDEHLAAILAGDLPNYGSPNWAAHPATLQIWRWAMGAHGAEVAWQAAEYLVRHGPEVRRGETTATILARRLACSIREWRRGASTHATRHELLAGTMHDQERHDPSLAPAAEPDALVVSDYLATAIGRQLTPDAARTLDDCALIAVDRCMALRRAGRAHPLQDLSGNGPCSGRLGPYLVRQLSDPTPLRSTVRLLVGTHRVPQAALLYQVARRARPLQVPIAIRASWAADALDLDSPDRPVNSRQWARRLARRAVLAVPATQLSVPTEQLAPAI
jgi:hypothetical protein